MALIGSIDPYVPGSSFSNYVELLEYFFASNNIDDNRKKDLFMNFAGMTVFEELKLLYPATDLKTLSYAEITKKLKERYDKVDSEIVLRYKFRCRLQGPTESGENYILAVKLLGEACDFGAFRDSAVRDQLVYGVYDKDLQTRLLNEEELTLKSAERIIKNKEMAVCNRQKLNPDENVNSVKFRLGRRESRYDSNRADRDRGRSRSRNRDNGHRHFRERTRSDSRNNRVSSKGRYANFVCHYCKAKGHIQRFCYQWKNSNRGAVKFVDEVDNEDPHDYFKRLQIDYDTDNETGDYPCLMIKTIKHISEPCLLEVNIENKAFKMEIGSGSAVSVISRADYSRNLGNVVLKSSKSRLP